MWFIYFILMEITTGACWTGEWMCSTAGTAEVTKKKCLPLPNIEPRSPSPQPATVQIELFQLIKYVFVIDFLPSGREDERSGLKFDKNGFPATPPESSV
jgi:hypothetical protein